MLTFTPILLRLVTLSQQKVPFVYQTRGTFLSDAFLAERDAHCVRDADFARDARLRRVNGTHRITYHSEAVSLITIITISAPLRLQRGVPHFMAPASIQW